MRYNVVKCLMYDKASRKPVKFRHCISATVISAKGLALEMQATEAEGFGKASRYVKIKSVDLLCCVYQVFWGEARIINV